jgi:predicted metalloendopeptidase
MIPRLHSSVPINRFRRCAMTRPCLLAAPALGLLLQLSAGAAGAAAAPVSGIELQYVDPDTKPSDDFYRYVNGRWLAHTEIPPDKGAYGAFYALRDTVEERLRGLVDELARHPDPADPDQRKIGDLYASFLDEKALEALGGKPLRAQFARIDALGDKSQIPALLAQLQRSGVNTPYTPQVHLDAKDPSRYVFDLGQDGLGMPDRDYYLKDEARLVQIRAKYLQHIERLLTLAGQPDAKADAQRILDLETALARVQWTKVENRDPVKTYNKLAPAQLAELVPGYDWKSYLAAAGVGAHPDDLVVSQPSYLAGLGRLLQDTPLAAWQAYLRWRVLSSLAPYLSTAYVDEHFDFHGRALRGIPQIRPRWKRGIALVQESLGEGLGRSYVARYFPPEYKAHMEHLVGNLLAAYRADIDTLAWMGPQTREQARAKLAKFTTKIGYPDHWRDYGALRIDAGDLAGNVLRANAFEYERNVAKLGRPVDRAEWDMSPQTVNAYYNPEMNEIVFPAAILQPPFFNPLADDAVNYGGIGAVIGHEISHGFDDQGSQYDGDGRLLGTPGWFTPDDLQRYKARTHALVQQYSAYVPVPGYPINGELTLGENIADNSGLAIAYQAYRLSLGGKPAPIIDGLGGDQRFFMGWAQVWRSKLRDNEAILRIKSDPHSPGQVRGTVPEMNQDAFYDAFGIHPGDRMFLAPEQRVRIW